MARTIGRFHLFEEIGRWDAGPIFRGFEVTGLVRPALVRTLEPSLRSRSDYIGVLLADARLSSELVHPNILRPIDAQEGEFGWYTAFERAPGRSLDALMRDSEERGVGLEPNAALHIIIELLGGLSHAHAHADEEQGLLDVVHRDVCPGNVWVSFAGHVAIGGFGYAVWRGRGEVPPPGIDQPRHGYQSPEQAAGHAVDPRSDVFSAGLILYELLAGRPAYEGDPIDIRAQARRGEIVPLRRCAPHVPAELEAVVEGALSLDPSYRFATASAFAEELTRFLASRGETFGPQRFSSALAALIGNELREDRRQEDERRRALEPLTGSGPGTGQAMGGRMTPMPQPHVGRSPQPGLGFGLESGGLGTSPSAAVVSPSGPALAPGMLPNSLAPGSGAAKPSPMFLGAHGTTTGSAISSAAIPGILPAAPGAAPARRSRLTLALWAATGCVIVGATFVALSSEANMNWVQKKLRAGFVGRKPGATLTIESIPPGAQVFIDREDTKRTTPLTINNIESEVVHEVRLELDGEPAVTSTISLRAATQRTVTLGFPGAMVNLSIRSEPSGAEITINGRAAAQFTPMSMDVRVGQPLKVAVQRTGYKPFEREVLPERGQAIALEVKLEKTEALLAAEREEAEAAAAEEPAQKRKPAKKRRR